MEITMSEPRELRHLEDMLNPDQERLIEYYRSNPGADWVTAAQDLGLEKDEVCRASFRLVFMLHLRAVQNRGNLEMQFEVWS